MSDPSSSFVKIGEYIINPAAIAYVRIHGEESVLFCLRARGRTDMPAVLKFDGAEGKAAINWIKGQT